MTEATVWVTFRQAGYHCWPNGPDYLKNKHRHMFHVKVSVHHLPVDGARGIEFHELLEHSRTIMRDCALRTHEWDYGDKSCEQIADAMAQRLCRSYDAAVTVTVSEDGECGATVTVRSLTE